jgi:hypothetical protein
MGEFGEQPIIEPNMDDDSAETIGGGYDELDDILVNYHIDGGHEKTPSEQGDSDNEVPSDDDDLKFRTPPDPHVGGKAPNASYSTKLAKFIEL